MDVTTIGLDVAKDVFQIHSADAEGRPVLRRRLRRSQVARFFANLPTRAVIAPQFVKPYVRSNKNDPNDAEAIYEAVSRPHMRFVAAKSVEQQDIHSLHRVRSRLVSSRTQLGHQIRGLLTEYGIVLPQHVTELRRASSWRMRPTICASPHS